MQVFIMIYVGNPALKKVAKHECTGNTAPETREGHQNTGRNGRKNGNVQSSEKTLQHVPGGEKKKVMYFLNREGAHQCSPSGEEDNSDRNYLLNHEREGFNVPRVVKEMM